jgi:hypothetical protein
MAGHIAAEAILKGTSEGKFVGGAILRVRTVNRGPSDLSDFSASARSREPSTIRCPLVRAAQRHLRPVVPVI